jgi:hypothetical protein
MYEGVDWPGVMLKDPRIPLFSDSPRGRCLSLSFTAVRYIGPRVIGFLLWWGGHSGSEYTSGRCTVGE